MFFQLLWRWFSSDLRTAEFKLLAVSLWLSMVLIISLSSFMQKAELMLVGQSAEFLAADRVISSPRPVDPSWMDKAHSLQLSTSQILSFQSMLYIGEEAQLVSVKAADSAYPLKGQLKYRENILGEVFSTKAESQSQGPAAGEIWVEARLLLSMGVELGEQVELGDAVLTIAKELVSEPDRGAGSFSLGPRVLMNLVDIEQTGAVQFGSRLRYRYLFSGAYNNLSEFYQYLEPQLSDSEKWLDLENAQPSIAIALKRGQRFFLLATSIVLVLASVAMSVASVRYGLARRQHIALLKTLGASRYKILSLLFAVAAVLLGLVSFIAIPSAYAIDTLLSQNLSIYMQLPLPDLSFALEAKPYLIGFFSAVIALLAFLWPMMSRLIQTPAIAIFKREDNALQKNIVISSFFGVAGALLMIALYSNSLLLPAILLLAIALLLVCIALPASLLLKGLKHIPLRAASAKQLALSQLLRRVKPNALLCSVFALSLSLLFILLAMRESLFEQWQAQLPDETPNYFLLNIAPEQWQDVGELLSSLTIDSASLYPMVRARLTEINSVGVRELVSKEAFSRSGADRELNLSWSEQLPIDNKIIKGQWWEGTEEKTIDETIPVSVESQLAEKLNIKLGDVLTFQVAADQFTAEVVNFREVEWDRMRPNFYMLFPKDSLKEFPKTFMTSFYLSDADQFKVLEILKKHPKLVLIDVDHLIKQIQIIVSQVSVGLNWVVLIVLFSGLLVLMAAIQSSLSDRLYENALLRALGASKPHIVGALAFEFFLLGFMAGVIAVIIGQVLLIVLQTFVLELPMSLQWVYWPWPPVLGGMLVMLVGLWTTRKVVAQSPTQLLKVF